MGKELPRDKLILTLPVRAKENELTGIIRRFIMVFGCSNLRTRMHAPMNKPQSCVENKLLGQCRASAYACDSCVVLVCKCAWRTDTQL